MIKYILFFLFLAMPLCLAVDLSDYPTFFNGDLALVTNKKQSSDHTVAAVNMIFSLPNSKGIDNLFDDQIKEINKDMILVGNPCQNKITKQLFGDDCTLGLKKGEGLIQYMNKEGNDIVLIAALNDEDLITVSEQVRNNPGILKGEKVIISEKPVEEGVCAIKNEYDIKVFISKEEFGSIPKIANNEIERQLQFTKIGDKVDEFFENLMGYLNDNNLDKNSLMNIYLDKLNGEDVTQQDGLEEEIKLIVEKNKNVSFDILLVEIMNKFSGKIDENKAAELIKKYM